MAERPEEPEVDAKETIEQASPAAVALALGRTKKGDKALDIEATAFLRDQRRLINLQAEHLHEQRELQTSRLRWGRFSDRMKAMLQVMTAMVGLSLAGAVAAMAWQAHLNHGLSIAPFSVPPDLAARGLTGQVVAARVLDRLSELQAETITGRPASSYAENWGDDIKVEIPETGVSLGELNRYLRQWLGHETRVTGEVVRTPVGVSVAARAGAESATTFSGPDADMDALIARASEAVYRSTQPYRYAAYLASHGHPDEALASYERLARTGTSEDQPWAYGGWSAVLLGRGDLAGVVRVVHEGQQRGLPLYESGALNNLGVAENQLSRNEAMVVAARQVLAEAERTGRGFGGLSREASERNMRTVIASHFGDYGDTGLRQDLDIEGSQNAIQIRPLAAASRIARHDVTGGLSLSGPTNSASYGPEALKMRADAELQNWSDLVAVGEREFAAQVADPRQRQVAVRLTASSLAIGYAHVGRMADALALVASTPLDCDVCVYARAVVAEVAGDRSGADRWFARAAELGPSLPQPLTNWGAALLARGEVDGAIVKLEAAHKKGPHFADPLELWGEALMRKGDFKGAVEKFAEADKDAPKWGRNHLRWGQALARLGKTDEAQAQWRAAQDMDLSAADRAELARTQTPAPR